MHGPTYSRSEYGIQNTERIPLQALEGIPIPPVLNRVIAQAEAAGRSGTEAASVFDKSSGLFARSLRLTLAEYSLACHFVTLPD